MIGAFQAGVIGAGGPILINGDFSRGLLGWETYLSGVISVVDGQLRMTNSGYAGARQVVPGFVSGRTYTVSVQIVNPGDSEGCYLSARYSGGNVVTGNRKTAGTLTISFVAPTSTIYIDLQGGNSNGTREFDDVVLT